MHTHKSESISKPATTLRQSLFWRDSVFDTIPFVLLHVTDGEWQRIYSLGEGWQISNSCASFPGALRKECFQGRTQKPWPTRHHCQLILWKQMKTLMWALINIKLSYSQPCRAIQWVAIKSFVLQFLYEAHENTTFFSCYWSLILIYDCKLRAVIKNICIFRHAIHVAHKCGGARRF